MTYFLAPLMACSAAFAAPITTGTLVNETVDLSVLAEFPHPAYKTIQFSSYDRSSVAPYAPGWYANSDGFGGEPTPNFVRTVEPATAETPGRYVMAEVEGPGAIVRTWTAAIAGEIELYLDGSETPVYSGDATRFLMWTYDHFAQELGLTQEDMPRGFRQNQACYFPIPFASGMRIDWIGNPNDIHFYQIETRLYPEGTEITTFQPSDLTTYADDIAKAIPMLANTDANWTPPQGRDVAIDVPAEPAARTDLFSLEAEGAIGLLELKLEAADTWRALRQVILKGYFDGAPQPQVEAPMGDFFGSGPGLNPFDTLPMAVRADGVMVCRFVMPFRERVVFVADNRGDQPVRITGRVVFTDRPWTERSHHFFAKWRVDHELLAQGEAGVFDLPYLCARGKGAFVGVAANILNPSEVPTEGGNWWGEGDEKIWVDDDTFPSLFGTGSEDYFNYAWSRPDLFWDAYAAQPLDTGPGTRGFVTNIRWHILDALPFEKSVDFFMELFHHSRTVGVTYARTAYFYATPELRDDHIPITVADVIQGLEHPRNWEPRPTGAASGSIFFQADEVVAAGAANTSVLTGAPWSRDTLLLWKPQAAGETLSFTLTAPEAGKYQVVLTCAVTPTGGTFEASLDGRDVMPQKPSLFTPHHLQLRNFWMETYDLEAGEHTLTLTSTGKTAESGGTEVGVDWLWLKKR